MIKNIISRSKQKSDNQFLLQVKGYKPHFSDEEKEVETRGVKGLGNTEISLGGLKTNKYAKKQYTRNSLGSLIYL